MKYYQKYNQKSIRLSDEVYNYINNFEGDNFNQKLENVVRFVCYNEKTLKKRVAFLDDEIRKRNDELMKLSSRINDLIIIDNKLRDIVNLTDTYICKIDKMSEVSNL